MILGLVGDLHIGARGGNPHVRKFISNYITQYLFPKFKELGVNFYIQAGDALDVRKHIHGEDMNFLLDEFVPAHEQYELEGHFDTGNHDITLRDSNRIAWTKVLSRISEGSILAYTEPTTVTIGDTKFCMIPWINNENYERSIRAISESDAEFCIGHLELKGFPMYRNSISEEGQVELETLNKFKKVITGHYHERTDRGNILYTGTPYHLTWQDFPSVRGFHTLDTITKEITFHPNPELMTMFRIFVYDYKQFELDERKVMLKEKSYLEDVLGLKGCILKVVVENRENAKHYSDFCAALRRCDLIDYTVIDKVETTVNTVGSSGGGEESSAPLITEEQLQTDVLQVIKERVCSKEGVDVTLASNMVDDIHTRAIQSGEV